MATAVSTFHNQYQWEGVVLDNNELQDYEKDKMSLRRQFFQQVKDLDNEEGECGEAKEKMENLLDEKIDPFTLRQGK